MSALFAFIIIFPTVVFVHELGHFLFARMVGIKVEAFSIGYGRSILSWVDKHGTKWKLGLFPLGGYVQMLGQNDLPGKTEKAKNTAEAAQHFEHKTAGQRAMVIFGGAFFNFIFAILVLWGYFMARGEPKVIMSQVISVVHGSSAEKAGIKEGDLIEGDVQKIVNESGGDFVKLVINGQEKWLEPKEDSGRYVIGVAYNLSPTEFEKLGFGAAAVKSVSFTWEASGRTLSALGQIITGARSVRELGGMITISEVGGRALDAGFMPFLFILAIISINLGLINLIPIPMLDGGHLFFIGLEAIIRRRVPEKVKLVAFNIGFGFIILLMIFVNLNDIMRLFGI